MKLKQTGTKLFRNSFVSVLFQFHFSCADSLSVPAYGKKSHLASADFRRRQYSMSWNCLPGSGNTFGSNFKNNLLNNKPKSHKRTWHQYISTVCCSNRLNVPSVTYRVRAVSRSVSAVLNSLPTEYLRDSSLSLDFFSRCLLVINYCDAVTRWGTLWLLRSTTL